MDQRAAWSAAGGLVMTTSGTNAAVLAVGSSAAGSHLPTWPAYAFGGIAVLGLYVVAAAWLWWWPLKRLDVPLRGF